MATNANAARVMRGAWLVAFAAAWTSVPALAADLELHATLDGANVVSATESTGTGEAHAWLDDEGRVRIELVFGGLKSGASGAALYAGEATENGDLVAELDVAPDLVRGRLDDIEIALSPEVAERMRAGETYLQVETPGFPDGAIRGQLVPQPVRLEDGVEPEEEDE
ncbi:MAG TPA: CHRD domain-containing protein [Xanthomonadaceae bacterium]|nr:CHRD domain-containing protein [Xanthomonadaceae bacterium]